MAILDPNTGQIVQVVTPPIPSVVLPTVTQAANPQAVYSASNIEQLATAPVQKPNLSDPYGLYDQFMNSAEIKAAKAAVSSGQADINKSNQALRTTTTALGNQNEQAMGGTGASVNLIGKQVGRARELTANELAALGETQNANLANLSTLTVDATNRYGIAQEQRSQLQDLIRQTGGKANISFGDTFESALQKADSYMTDKAKKEKDDAYKQSLKAIALELGVKTSGSSKDLENRIKKSKKSALDDAKKLRDLQYNTAMTAWQKSKEELNGGNTFKVADLYGSNTVQTSNGGVSTNNPSAYSNSFNVDSFLNQ